MFKLTHLSTAALRKKTYLRENKQK